jgi:hypothetical protein
MDHFAFSVPMRVFLEILFFQVLRGVLTRSSVFQTHQSDERSVSIEPLMDTGRMRRNSSAEPGRTPRVQPGRRNSVEL